MWLLFLLSNEKKQTCHLSNLPNELLGVGGQEWDGNIEKNKAEQMFVMLLVTAYRTTLSKDFCWKEFNHGICYYVSK